MESIVRLAPGGQWHRRFGARTRCGLPIAGPTSSRDRKPEDNNLCPRCFTRLEIDTGKMKKIEREVAEYNDPDLFWDDEADTDPDGDPDAE